MRYTDPHHEAFGSLSAPFPGNLLTKKKKMLMRGLARGGRDGMGAAGIDRCISYLILSYLILSYLILSYLILSYLILSYLILSYLMCHYMYHDS